MAIVQVGLGVAVQQLLDIGQQAIWERIQLLAARLRRGLAAVPGVTVRDRGRVLCGIVSWTKASRQKSSCCNCHASVLSSVMSVCACRQPLVAQRSTGRKHLQEWCGACVRMRRRVPTSMP